MEQLSLLHHSQVLTWTSIQLLEYRHWLSWAATSEVEVKLLCHVKQLNLEIIKTYLSPEQRIIELECRTHVGLVHQVEVAGFSFRHHLCTFAAMEVCDLAARCSQYLRSRSLIPESRTALAASSSFHCLHSPACRRTST